MCEFALFCCVTATALMLCPYFVLPDTQRHLWTDWAKSPQCTSCQLRVALCKTYTWKPEFYSMTATWLFCLEHPRNMKCWWVGLKSKNAMPSSCLKWPSVAAKKPANSWLLKFECFLLNLALTEHKVLFLGGWRSLLKCDGCCLYALYLLSSCITGNVTDSWSDATSTGWKPDSRIQEYDGEVYMSNILPWYPQLFPQTSSLSV